MLNGKFSATWLPKTFKVVGGLVCSARSVCNVGIQQGLLDGSFLSFVFLSQRRGGERNDPPREEPGEERRGGFDACHYWRIPWNQISLHAPYLSPVHMESISLFL